jgi:hypothetical protein
MRPPPCCAGVSAWHGPVHEHFTAQRDEPCTSQVFRLEHARRHDPRRAVGAQAVGRFVCPPCAQSLAARCARPVPLGVRAVKVVHVRTSRLGVACGARVRRAVGTAGSVLPSRREAVLLAYSAVAGAVACGRQRLVSLAAPRGCAQLAEQQPFSRCRPGGARQCNHTDQPVRPPLAVCAAHGPRHGALCTEGAPCDVQAPRLQLLDRHAAGQTVLHLHHGQRVV